MTRTPTVSVVDLLLGRIRRHAERAGVVDVPEWKQLQRLRPVRKPGPWRNPPPKAKPLTERERRARRLSTRASRRRAARLAARS